MLPRRQRLLRIASLALFALFPASLSKGQACSSTTFIQSHSLPGPFLTSIGATFNDLNSDGAPDAVFVSYWTGDISVMLNDGAGTFGAPMAAGTTLLQPIGALLEDFDGDNDLDVVVMDAGLSLAFAQGLGDGTFAAPVVTAIGSFIGNVMSGGDFDGDGNRDLLFINYDSVVLLRGNGAGVFTESYETSVVTSGSAAAVADLNGDGRDDAIFVAGQHVPTIASMLGQPDGSLGDPESFVAGPSALHIEVADVNGDGDPDAVVSLSDHLAVLPGNGDGTFQASYIILVDARMQTFTLDDIDADGALDFVAHDDDSVIQLLFDPFDGEVGPIHRYLVYPAGFDIQVDDANQDGLKDLLIPNYAVFTVLPALSPRVYEAVSLIIPHRLYAQAVTDVNGDGVEDLVASLGAGLDLVLGAVDRQLGFGDALGNLFVQQLAAGDFDGDGFGDVLTLSAQGLEIYRGSPAGNLTFLSSIPDYVGDLLRTGDFDGDGLLDFAGTQYATGSLITVWYGNGDGTFADETQTSEGIALRSLEARDVTGDGLADLVGLTWEGDEIVTWVSQGRSFGPEQSSTFTLTEGTDLAIGQLTGSEALDVVVAGVLEFQVLLGNASGAFSPGQTVSIPLGQAFDVIVDDFNDDGFEDVLTGFHSVYLFPGSAGGTFGPSEPQGLPSGELISLDWDGNGSRDLAVVSVFSGPQNAYAVFNARLAVSLDVSEALCLGSEATLRARAAGYGPVSYQWRKDGVPLTDGGSISGATTDTLTIDPVASGDAGDYDVVVTDLCTSVTSETGEVSVVSQPPAPAITAPDTVAASTTGLTASVPDQPGHAYTWTLTGGTITAGQGTSQITFTSGPAGTTMQVSVEDVLGNCAAASSTRAVQVQFADVALGDPYSPFIHTIARNGVTAGCGGGNYCPDLNVTRAQMAIFLLISKNGALYTPPPATGLIFLDVPANAFAAAFIEAIAAAQVTSGCGGGNYCPDFFIRRSEMAVFLLRTLEGPTYNPPPATGTVFGDVAAGDFAAAWIEEIADRGITGGCGGGNFCPNDFVSRAQMAVFLTTTFDLM